MLSLPAQILGQDPALRLLQSAIQHRRVAPAYCFVGPDGVGKALSARWFSQALLCRQPHARIRPCGECVDCQLTHHGNHPDLLWVEPTYLHQGKLLTAAEAADQQLQRRSPPQIRLEQIQNLIQFASRTALRMLPSDRDPAKAIILEGSETLAEPAANALLKTLEEPAQSVLILIAPQLSDLLPTLISRCQVIRFQRLSATHLSHILGSLGHPDPLAPLLALAQGSPGAALQAIQQWQQIPADLINALHQWPTTLPQALSLGRTIARSLDIPSQLWLVDYLQHYFWQQQQTPPIRCLERIRLQLLAYVQPQLVWEMNLSPGWIR